ncbi:ATP-binding protein [Hymenobacter sp. NST-14]|uniref:AlbA family DNA-binding domain-containing protein n=1 Tax=Hymenobacter piscis TaxID=2839984 RepID=UPI001C021CB9|nr:ATP-binding protein [Hymenobacter piscis]MBT9393169.1 ATP-binding protein [Hymenobacter piscis]
MYDIIEDIIAYGNEGHSIDFKQQQYNIGKHAKKHEILKDISAFANHPSNEDKYIIIGIEEANGSATNIHHIQEIVDEAKYQQYIHEYLEPEIKFEYKSFLYKDNQIAFFRIYDNHDRPYLIKKDVKNSIEGNKIEFREGDGFIRRGTSIKRMTRVDFDKIYQDKQKRKDRKEDIILKAYIGNPSDDEISKYDFKYLDFSIENKSNTSIKLDVDVHIYKSDSASIILEHELKYELHRRREEKNKHKSFSSFTPFTNPSIFSRITKQDFPEKILLSKSRDKTKAPAIDIQQQNYAMDIFNQEIIALYNNPSIIKLEVVIRSDDFYDGPLLRPIEISLL